MPLLPPAVTQFEATDARRALPCIDEPAAKARFDVTLLVSPSLTAVSNMPVLQKTTTAASADEPTAVSRGLTYPANLSRYQYYTSPIMSTYLLAVVVGEFDYISKTSRSGTEVRVYTGLGKSHLGRFSLDTAVAALDFYNEYFGIPYVRAMQGRDGQCGAALHLERQGHSLRQAADSVSSIPTLCFYCFISASAEDGPPRHSGLRRGCHGKL
jgi:hypothetical protein